MGTRCIVVLLLLTALGASACDAAPAATPLPPPTTLVGNSTASVAASTAAATRTPGPAATASNVPPTQGPTPRFRTPTPPADPGTVITNDGASLVLSHPDFLWTLRLPRDWVITYDRGFEVFANNPQGTASVRMFSQAWLSEKEWLPNARAYVNYWKQYPGGSVFPVFAAGTQLAESEVGAEKYGGPYLRFEFDAVKRGLHYWQIYASGGGPNAIVLTAWTKPGDRGATEAALESILSSVALLKRTH